MPGSSPVRGSPLGVSPLQFGLPLIVLPSTGIPPFGLGLPQFGMGLKLF